MCYKVDAIHLPAVPWDWHTLVWNIVKHRNYISAEKVAFASLVGSASTVLWNTKTEPHCLSIDQYNLLAEGFVWSSCQNFCAKWNTWARWALCLTDLSGRCGAYLQSVCVLVNQLGWMGKLGLSFHGLNIPAVNLAFFFCLLIFVNIPWRQSSRSLCKYVAG